MTVPWLLGVARHKLADHYRRRHDRFSIPVAELPEPVDPADDWDVELDRIVAESVLAKLSEQHRTVLALRYMDDCSVPECAELIGRTVHATEALLVRARRAFKTAVPGAGRRDVMNNSYDPLTVLHGDELPIAPDPGFAARLRSRLESALSLPNRTQGVEMSGTDTAIADLTETTTHVASAPPRPAALPYLCRRQRSRGHRLVRRHLRCDGGRRTVRDGRRPHRPCRVGDRRRRALPRRRVSRARAESA